jgi:molybdopterin converting factor small subunit
MKVTMHTFGAVKDYLDDREWDIEEGMTIRDLRHQILEQYPELRNQFFRMAIGSRMAEDDMLLTDGDDISLMPPFSGG